VTTGLVERTRNKKHDTDIYLITGMIRPAKGQLRPSKDDTVSSKLLSLTLMNGANTENAAAPGSSPGSFAGDPRLSNAFCHLSCP
jgi:hypothetical protein